MEILLPVRVLRIRVEEQMDILKAMSLMPHKFHWQVLFLLYINIQVQTYFSKEFFFFDRLGDVVVAACGKCFFVIA